MVLTLSALLLLSACGGSAPTAADAPSASAVPTAAVVIQAEELARVSEIGRLGRGKAVLWEAESGRAVRLLAGHQDWVKAVAWSADGRLILSGGYDGTLRRWSAR